MKKITRLSLVGPVLPDAQTARTKTRSNATAATGGSKRRPGLPLNQMLRVRDDVDTINLLEHASELLGSLAAISENFAEEFDGSRRHVAVAIKQLSALAEIVVCRARDNLASPGSPTPDVRH